MQEEEGMKMSDENKETIMFGGRECTVSVIPSGHPCRLCVELCDVATDEKIEATRLGGSHGFDTVYVRTSSDPDMAAKLHECGLGDVVDVEHIEYAPLDYEFPKDISQCDDWAIPNRVGSEDRPVFRFDMDALARLDPQGTARYREVWTQHQNELAEDRRAAELSLEIAPQVRAASDARERAWRPALDVTIEEHLSNLEDVAVFNARVCTDYIERLDADAAFAKRPVVEQDLVRAAVLDRVASVYEESTGCRANLMPGLVPNYARDLFYAGVGLYEQLGGDHPTGVSVADMHQLAHDVIDRACAPVGYDPELVSSAVSMPVYRGSLSDSGKAWAKCDLLHSREHLAPEFEKPVRGMRRRPEDLPEEVRALAESLCETQSDEHARRIAAETIFDGRLGPKRAVAIGAYVTHELHKMVWDESPTRFVPDPFDTVVEYEFQDAFVIEGARRGLVDDPALLNIAKDPKMEHVIELEHASRRRVPDVPDATTQQQATDTIDY